ncbi:MAG TPA: hypothetical protein VHC19_09670 [Pirellulales bacterium]|nr:hypothetical protein [Pirellulales bacterium]
MKYLISAMAAILLAFGLPAAHAKDRTPAPALRFAARRAAQSAPVVQSVPSVQQQGEAESLPAETLRQSTETAPSEDPLQSEQMLRGSGIPSSPYPAGLSYMMTPQPFRVPYPDRIYYPPRHYVHLCPYYPSGAYLGADWYKRLLGHNPWLIHGCKRFNPYLTAAKQRHFAKRHAGAQASMHGAVPCPDCEPMETFAAGEPLAQTTAEAPRRSEADAAETPPLPRMELIAQPPQRSASAGQTAEDSSAPARTSSVRIKPTRTANSALPPWQRAPAVRR